MQQASRARISGAPPGVNGPAIWLQLPTPPPSAASINHAQNNRESVNNPTKTNLQDHAKILQESCMQVLLGTCTRYVPFLARFLHSLAHILQEMVQDFAQE